MKVLVTLLAVALCSAVSVSKPEKILAKQQARVQSLLETVDITLSDLDELDVPADNVPQKPSSFDGIVWVVPPTPETNLMMNKRVQNVNYEMYKLIAFPGVWVRINKVLHSSFAIIATAVAVCVVLFGIFYKLDWRVRAVYPSKSVAPRLRDKLLHEIFERTAYTHPHNVAVESRTEGLFLTYEELQRHSNNLGLHLQHTVGHPLRDGSLVAIYLPRCSGQYVAQLGILKSGAGYLPIDDINNMEKVNFTLLDSGAVACLTTPELAKKLRLFNDKIEDQLKIVEIRTQDLVYGNIPTYSKLENRALRKPRPSMDDTAYVIYTAGSDSDPKGVPISHRNASTFITGFADVYNVSNRDRVLQGFSTAFDSSVEEVWMAFAFGGTLCPVTKQTVVQVDQLLELVESMYITVFSSVPSVLAAMAKNHDSARLDLPKLRLLIAGGESLKNSTVRAWTRPNRRILNTYGVTECTVACAWSEPNPGEKVSIGVPFAGYNAYVLKPRKAGDLVDSAPLPVGQVGELCIGGPAVSRGYINNEKESAAVFSKLRNGDHVYHTGDLVRIDEVSGQLMHLGKIDTQAKIKGYRVELGEIESAIASVPPVVDVVVCQKGEDNEALVAYCIVNDENVGQFNVDEIKVAINAKLASYMVPTHFMAIRSSQVVRTKVNQKIDRQSLPWPIPSALASVQAKPKLNVEDQAPKLLHHMFERSVKYYPDYPALEVPASLDGTRPHQMFTYAEVERMANELALQLRHPKLASKVHNPIVPIYLPRHDPLLYVAQLAAMKSGGAYTILEPGLPRSNFQFIVEDTKPAVVITSDEYAASLADMVTGVHILDAAPIKDAKSGPPIVLPNWDISQNDCAYVIYTSGTTGKPKGCLVEHEGVAQLMEHNRVRFDMTPRDRSAQSASTTFDASIEEIYLAFAAGAALVVMTDEIKTLGPDLIPWLRDMRITAWCPCPTMLRMTDCKNPHIMLPELRVLYPGGEPLTKDVASTWGRGRILQNGYGPTEATCVCMSDRVKVDDNGNIEGGVITIGKPTYKQIALVLNDELKEVPFGEEGELVIVGNQVARGYLNRPELTAEKFVHIEGYGRGYRTGDLVKQIPDGRFVCLGRIDAQVKLHGHRIELESVESTLCTHPLVSEAACDVQSFNGAPRMVAFVICHSRKQTNGATSQDQDRADLAKFLKNELPASHVPSFFVFVDDLSRLPSGKINRKALKLIEWTPTAGESEDLSSDVDNDFSSSKSDTSEDSVSEDDELKDLILAAFLKTLAISKLDVNADFFQSGGNSLLASQAISILRKEDRTKALVVRDVYNLRTVSALAAHLVEIHHRERGGDTINESHVERRRISAGNLEAYDYRRWVCLVAQLFTLVFFAFLSAFFMFGVFSFVLPVLTLFDFTALTILYLFPALAAVGYFFYWFMFVLMTFMAVTLKWVLIGKIRPGKHRIWGLMYFRFWLVRRFCTAIPYGVVEGTVFKNWVLRMMGAKIGKGVAIHKGSFMMEGCWDLLEIGDNTSIASMVIIKTNDYMGGYMHFGPVKIGKDCTLGLGSVIKGYSTVPDGCMLDYFTTVDSHHELVPNTLYSGTPAAPKGPTPPPFEGRVIGKSFTPTQHGFVVVALGFVNMVSDVTLAVAIASFFMWQLDTTYFGLIIYIYGDGITRFNAAWNPSFIMRFLGILAAGIVLMTVWRAFKCRFLWPKIRPGVYSRWGVWYTIMTWKTRAVASSRDLLSGSMVYCYWLWLAGANIGEYCEISEIFDVIPELLTIKGRTWTSSVVFFDMPRVSRGLVLCSETVICHRCYFGNYACVPPGTYIPNDTLIGVSTVAPRNLTDADAGKSWFGRPAFELPQREVFTGLDPRMTGEAPPYIHCVIFRGTWEAARLLVGSVMGLLSMWILYSQVYYCGLGPMTHVTRFIRAAGFPLQSQDLAFGSGSLTGVSTLWSPECYVGYVPTFFLLEKVILLAVPVVMKWVFLGKIRAGVTVLWSQWPCRWDYLFIVWAQTGAKVAANFEGTLLMGPWLMLFGTKVGKNVLFTSGGAAQLSEPDLVTVGDHCIVDQAPWQSHTFEDGVMKRAPLYIGNNCRIGENAMILYGSHMLDHSVLYANSAVMKDEKLTSYTGFAGCPLQPLPFEVCAGENIFRHHEAREAVVVEEDEGGDESRPLLSGAEKRV